MMAQILPTLIIFTLLGFTTIYYNNPNLRNWLTETKIPILFEFQKPTSPKPETYIFSEDPLVIYIPNFITPSEAIQLVDLSSTRFKPSVLWTKDGKANKDANYRSSQTATLEQDHGIVRAVEERARGFWFYVSGGEIEPLVVQRYGLGEQYRDHYDWFPDGPTINGNRESTFFVYIEANCTGGGTNFPRLKPPTTPEAEQKWCEYIDCDRPIEDGVTFKPITGNAVFWRNLKEGEGKRGHRGTLHAGLPVTSGSKMGLNVWTWERG